jgi:putative salt-induced outer membrane protein YdiY
MGAGAGVRHREFSGESANWNALVDAFQTLNFSINDRLTLKQRVAVYAVPDLPDDFQVKFRAALVSSITEALDMSVRYEFEYDGSINHDIRNIERLLTSIGYAF